MEQSEIIGAKCGVTQSKLYFYWLSWENGNTLTSYLNLRWISGGTKNYFLPHPFFCLYGAT